MASLPKSDQWSITYSLRNPARGFHWTANSQLGTWHLVPNWEVGRDPWSVEPLTGTRVAFDALSSLRRLGVSLRELGKDGIYLLAGVREFRDAVLPIANKYGDVFEVYDPVLEGRNPFSDHAAAWWHAAHDVADLWDLRRAMVEGQPGLVADRFLVTDDVATFKRSNGQVWKSPGPSTGDRVWSRRPRWKSTPERVTHAHIWAVFAHAVNGYLDSALSIELDPTEMGNPRIVVRGLAPVACARLWLEVVHQRADELGQPQTCRNCKKPIQGTRRKQFCSNRCRMAFSRTKAA